MSTTTAAQTSPITEIDAPTLRAWTDAGRAVIVDVREADEHARERIPGSHIRPLSGFDPAEVPADTDVKKVVLHCRSGTRSSEAAARLVAAGRTEVTVLKGGIEAWKAAGLKTEVNRKAPLPIMRQVQITAGSIVLAGSILAWLVSPWFLAVTAFIGAGLTVSGLTGTCGMASVLGHMPWNRTPVRPATPPAEPAPARS